MLLLASAGALGPAVDGSLVLLFLAALRARLGPTMIFVNVFVRSCGECRRYLASLPQRACDYLGPTNTSAFQLLLSLCLLTPLELMADTSLVNQAGSLRHRQRLQHGH